MVRDTHTQHNDHVRRINDLFADAKRRTSSAEPPKYVDIELINKKCNVHRGLTPHSTTQGTNHNFSNNYLGSRRGSAASNHSNSGLYNNYNILNTNGNNTNNGNNKKSKSHLNLTTTGLMTSSDEDAADTFIKDLQKRQSFSEHYHRDMQKKQIHDQLEAITGDKYRKRTNNWNSDFKKNIEHPSAFPSLLRSSTPSTFHPRQKESIASQVAAEVIEATAAAMRGENGDSLYGGGSNGGYLDRRSSINSLKNDSLNGSTRKLNATKRPSFGSTSSNLNNNYRRDSAVSLKSTPGSKRNSVDRTDGLMTNSYRGGSVPPSSNLTGGGRRGSTSYDSSYGSLPRRRSSTIGYDSRANTPSTQYGSLPRKNGTTKDPKRYVSTGNLLTRKLSSEPRDYVNTMGSSKLYSSPRVKTTPLSSSLKTTTPFKTHSILRKSSSPTTQFESFDSDTSAGNTSRSSLTKENLTRHVRILEDAEHEKRRLEHNLLEDIQDTDDLFHEYHNSNNNGKRFSIDSLDIRKNSAIDLIEEDILANLSMNDINETTTDDTTRSTTTTKTERKIHNGNLLCDTNSTCTDISLLNRDYYNIPKNNPKYSGLSRNNGNSNNINSNGLKSGSKLQQQQLITTGVKSSSTLNLSSIENDNNNNSNNSNNNMNSGSNPNKCNFEIQCENGIRKHNNGINNIILQQQNGSSLSSTSSQSHNHNNNNKKNSSLQSSTIKDHNNINCFDCNPHLQQTIQQQHQQHQTALLSSSSNITSTNHNNNTNIINKKNKKNLLISRSVDDLRLEDHLFNNNYQTTELLKYNKQPHLQKLLQHQQQLQQQQQLNYNCCNTDNYNKNQLNRNSITNQNNNNRNIINLDQSSSPSIIGSSRILTNINTNNNTNNINNTNQNSNKILQHNFPKQKSALYQIKNKHYSMDNLLTAVNQHFIDIDNNYNSNNNNNNIKNGFTYQGDTDRPQFVAVTSLDECQAIRCAEFHPNGKLYAVGSNSKTFRICEYPSLVDIREDHTAYQPIIVYEKQKYHKGSIYCMDWSPDGELIATGSNDKTIKLMRYNDITKQLEGREIELTMHDGTIRDVCFIEDTSNKASLLISGGAGDNKIYVTDCGTATPFQSLSGHSGHILSLYNWGGAMFVSGSHDKTIRFWDLRTRSCVNTVTPSTQPGLRHGSPVAAVCVDPSGRLLVSGHEDSSCVLYDIRGNRPIQCFKPHTADIRSIRFSPSAYYLLTAGYDKKLMLTDLQGDLTLQLPSVTVANHNDKVISGRWHPTDFSFLSTSADKTCVLWALTSKP